MFVRDWMAVRACNASRMFEDPDPFCTGCACLRCSRSLHISARCVWRSDGVRARSFPRFVRVREDKRPDEATTPDVICDLFRAQTRKMVTAQEAVAARAPAPAGGAAAAGAGGPAGAHSGDESGDDAGEDAE